MANTTETSPGIVVNDTAVGNQLWNNPNPTTQPSLTADYYYD